jgi:hypothetical protein
MAECIAVKFHHLLSQDLQLMIVNAGETRNYSTAAAAHGVHQIDI